MSFKFFQRSSVSALNTSQPRAVTRPSVWMALMLIAGSPRVLAACLLPNAFGDAYSYIREVTAMSEKISAGTFALTDLYGFWLPLYQFICAVVTALTGHPDYVAKLVSAFFGVALCLLVYDISLRLTGNRRASLLAFMLIALSPLHIHNSASSMTDVPHAFFVIASASFVLRRRWLAAACFGALAGLTRVDSWMLLGLIPALQILFERRLSLYVPALLAFPPVFWLYISWKATGDWLACFTARKQYMDALLDINPGLAGFSLSGVARDSGALLLSTDLAVLIACLVGGWLAGRRVLRYALTRDVENLSAVFSLCIFFFAYLSLLGFAYLTQKQPIIFPRYGLILFALGVPVLPWTFLRSTSQRPHWTRRLLTGVIVICLLNAAIQLTYSVGFINREYASRAVADFLRTRIQLNPDAHIFTDDGTVLALSGLAPERFHSSVDAPRDRDMFLSFLKQKNVTYLVFVNKSDSTPARLFPELQDGAGNELFQPVMSSRSKFLPLTIWLYRVRQTSD